MTSRKTHGNTEGPDRPADNREYSEYEEVNQKTGLTGDDLMSADINGPDSDYEGWNGVDDVPQEEYKDLLDC